MSSDSPGKEKGEVGGGSSIHRGKLRDQRGMGMGQKGDMRKRTGGWGAGGKVRLSMVYGRSIHCIKGFKLQFGGTDES